jgi:hypothetical protein
MYSPVDQAAILFTTYLSEPIQRECESFKNDINAIRNWLIRRYGDLRVVVDSKLRLISKLRHPASSPESRIEYFKLIVQLLLHVESLSNNDFVDSVEIRSIIYNSTLVKSIVSFMPDWIITRFSKMLEAEPRFPLPSGERYFILLKGLIDTVWRELDTANSIKSCRDYATPNPDNRKGRSTIQVSSAGHHESAVDQPPVHCVNDSINVVRTLSFPCTFHGSGKPDHELGLCQSVFSWTNKTRSNNAKRLKLCFSCFKPECLKMSPKVG